MWRVLKKLEIELPYDPAIPLLGIHTEETRRERDMCTPMFIAALFIIARTRKVHFLTVQFDEYLPIAYDQLTRSKKQMFSSVQSLSCV